MKSEFKHIKKLFLFLSIQRIEIKPGMLSKPKKDYSNEEILVGIQEENPEVFRYIQFKTFPVIYKFIKQNKGTKENADEIFQDALIVVFKKNTKGSLQLRCKFTTYFIGICKTIWKYNYKNGNPLVIDAVDVVEDEKEIEDLYKESKEFQLYRKCFKQLKDRQQKILLASLSNKPYKELFMDFGFKSTDVFKTEVNRIKKRLIENIVSDPNFKKYNGEKNWSL